MKNIFSKLGTKTIAGAVLVGATFMVGLGVVNNFSDGKQKAANEVALSRFGNRGTMGGSSASRADLERQMLAAQEGYSARFLKGKADGSDDGSSYSSDGAYEEGVRADEGFVYSSDGGLSKADFRMRYYNSDGSYANGDMYNPFGSTYEQGEGGMGEDFSDSAAYGEIITENAHGIRKSALGCFFGVFKEFFE